MLLVQNIARLIVDADTVLPDAALLIGDDGRIAAVGARVPAPAGCETLDASRCAVLPGLINAHTHLWQQAAMGRRDDLPLSAWVDAVLTPSIRALYAVRERDKRARLAYLIATLGACQMLHSGVTSFLDMELNYAQDGMQEACAALGVRGYFGVELADRFLPDGDGKRRDMAEITRLLAKYPGSTALTPSELNLCSDEALRFIADAAEKTGAPVQMHVGETAREAAQVKAERGAASLLALDRFSLLSPRFSAVHGIHMGEDEIALAAKRGISVVYDPKSNMKLASGVCPVRTLLAAGINVALATDGPASNDRLDMFEELRAGVLLQKISAGDPGALTARDVFAMATMGGARLLGLDAGRLCPGCLADFSVLPLDAPHLIGAENDIVSALVHCAASGDVRDVFVGGRRVLKDDRVPGVDETALAREMTEILAEGNHVQSE